MTTTLANQSTTASNEHFLATPTCIREQVVAYYTAATADYKVWSKGFNMHFGYWRLGINPFNREAMLNEMNLQVLARLNLPADRPARIADLGGGTGATARSLVAARADLTVDVVTIAPNQVELGETLNRHAPHGDAITMHCADYVHTGLPSNAFDAVIMVESACHAEGATKATLMREAYRLLKPGGRLIMADAMLRQAVPNQNLLGRVMTRLYERWCVSWAVPEMCRIDLMPMVLKYIGFQEPKIENWSNNVMMSVAHVPILASYFAIAEVIKARGWLPTWRWRHIVASILTPLLGLYRCTFTYSAMIADKPLMNQESHHARIDLAL
ncbi:methyltransferase domain-containing protein [Chitinivorax sp. B]|uniref:SAM-dependent methyltransferase n=1 Tax=Chitinivorax sp. B TaxID=2502235 RepID=UPI0010FA09E5|nr:methyltransferase domain-containing protein [Chitinivorax sp. B]